jgi:hypothetical protein
VIHDAIGWALTKDIGRLYSIMARMMIFLSSILIQNLLLSASMRSRSWASACG